MPSGPGAESETGEASVFVYAYIISIQLCPIPFLQE